MKQLNNTYTRSFRGLGLSSSLSSPVMAAIGEEFEVHACLLGLHVS